MEQTAKSTLPGEPPRGTFQARIDDKGRLKLPADIQKYVERLNEKSLFITTLDQNTVRLYPTAVWQENEAFFVHEMEDAEPASDLQFIANHFGADSPVDAQGRVLMPARLREKIPLEDQPVWLECQKGRINLYNQQVYEERLSRAQQGLAEKLRALEKRGLR